MRNKTSVTFVAAALALLVGHAAAVPYTFTNIADNPSEFADLFFFNSPSLNNSGMVAFVVGQFSDGERQRDTVASGRTRLEEGTFIGSGGPTTTLYDNSGPFHDFGSPSLNDSGTAAFVAFLDTGEVGIFTGSGGPTTTISDTRGLFNFFAVPSLNDDGTVAFFATLNTGGAGFFTGNGGPPHDYRRQQRI